MFSPRYARARAKGNADPMEHCALNVALYGRHGRWAYTERGSHAVRRAPREFTIGASRLTWSGSGLSILIDEIGAPLPARIRGHVHVAFAAPLTVRYPLDAHERHRWQPIAPDAGVEVRMDSPRKQWTGTGYVDANDGDEPLEDAFRNWHWARTRTKAGAVITYDVSPRVGDGRSLALRIGVDGGVARFAPPPLVGLPATGWRIARAVRSEAQPCVAATLEDTPFYARSLLTTTLDDERVTTMHESLSLDRFRRAWVRALLPFRMRRE